jgi:hypothetical protein
LDGINAGVHAVRGELTDRPFRILPSVRKRRRVMRTTCRFVLGIGVFVAAAGLASAQQPDPSPPLPPLPQAQVTPPPSPEAVPPTEQTSATTVPVPNPATPDLVVTATAKPVKKASNPPARKPAQATASKKPIEKPATPESTSKAREATATGSVTATDSSSPPPPGAASTADVPAGTTSPVLSLKPPPAVDPAVQAEMDRKTSDALQRKKSTGGWILIGVGALALIGLAVFFVRTRSGVNTLPPIFDGAQSLASVPLVPTYPGRTTRSLPK